jgi:hypothetical protein
VGSLAGQALRAALPLAGWLAMATFLDWADWGRGPYRTAGLVAAALALGWLWRRPPGPARGALPWVAVLTAIAVTRLAWQLALLPTDGPHRQPNDIGWTTERAVATLATGGSIYSGAIDPQRDLPGSGTGLHWYQGYKYGPVTPRYYAPFLRALGAPLGLYTGNALLLALAAALAAALARRAGGGPEAIPAALFCVLAPGMISFELLHQGVNDLLPTALGLAALLAALYDRAGAAGIALGLSLACKPLPGLLLLPFLLGTVNTRWFLTGLAAGLLPLLPDLLATPREMIASLLVFNLLRPTTSTSLAHHLPGWAIPLLALAGLAAVGVAAWRYHRSRSTANLLCAAALGTAAFLATGKLIHRNYLLWLIPLAAAAVAARCYPATAPGPGRR